ncbi:hypothetical protein [Pseudomonas sp. Marseille-Q1929]|uniref:hypothetical protein n=1 Tax=Pseudomonas sp. Marseille-Q1929 TaxID=2730402 RepID=UPI001A8D4252|nr:hypothetical protein [Pseudomonas sp. Marseille-Q1929]MBO0496210.1 hypothetical protein [Pseudomonas sp. Marseille-Q1929]
MTLKKLLYCLVDPEPLGYYAESGADAVNLSFECSGDVPTDVAEAKKPYESFLQFVQGPISFVSYRVDAAELAAPVPIKTQLPAAALPVNNALFNWLEKRATSDRFWVATGDSAEVEVDEVGAGSLLRAAQAWNAPVGHSHGLTYVIWRDLEAETAADSNAVNPRRVIVPIVGEAPDSVLLGDDEHHVDDEQNTLEFKHSLGSKIPSLFCHTVIFSKTEAETDAYPFIKSGYLKVNQEAAGLHRLLNGFEQRAASLLAVTPALLPPSGANNPGEDDYKNLYKRDENGNLPAIFTWAAITGLLTQLDAFVIALLRPLSSAESEGALLAPLITTIIDAINHANAPANPPAAVTARLTVPERRGVAEAVRNALRHSPIFTASDEHPPSRLIRALSVAHELTGPVDSESKVSRALLLALLDVKRPEYPALALNNERYKELRLAIGETPELTLLEKALATLQATLYTETGAESAIIRLFESSVDPAGKESSVGSVIAKELDLNASDALKKAVGEGWAQYCALLTGVFVNGADAVRHLCGLEFLTAVYANPIWHGEDSNKVKAAEVAELISNAEYFRGRLEVSSNATEARLFHKISDCLVKVKSAPFIDPLPLTVLEEHLSKAYNAAIRTVGDLSGERQRFVPDLIPQPLPMQIASDVSGDQLQTFLNDFNGIAIAISRNDSPGNSRRFAHANLAALTWPGQDPGHETLSIQPFLPVVNDGRGHAFIEYHGVPFADSSYAHLLDVPSDPGVTKEQPSRESFYQAGLSSKEPLELPRLAYGCRFESFAFATTNAGTLPLTLQATSAPWLPGPITAPGEAYIAKTVYQRRTAIGEVELVEGKLEKPGNTQSFLAAPKDRQRINRAISDVVALSSDYPRSSLVASKKGQATLDLFRESDGAGTLLLPSAGQDQPLELRFAATQFSGNGRLFLQVVHGVLGTPDIDSTDPELELTEQVAGAGAFTLTLTQDGASVRQDNGPGKDFKFLEQKVTRCWIRLVLEAVNGDCALTFATPEGPKGSRPSSRLLLLTPPSGDWRPEIKAEEVTFKVSTPRVGYLDFQRWMANSTLRDAAFGDESLKFVNALEQLYKIRHLSPALAQFFDRLPDPAVRGIRYTLCETDRLVGKVTATPLVGEVMWGELKTTGENFVDLWPAQMNNAIKALMDGIDKACSFTLTLASDSTWSMAPESKDVKCTVPAGTVAHLSIEALVPQEHFSAPDAIDLAPIHAGLLQYASAKSGNQYAFPLAALCIETMIDKIASQSDAINLIKDVISLEDAGSARRYDIVAGAQEPPAQWRLYSHASVHTQQWLYSGRPLYRSLEPRQHAFPGKRALSAALRVNSDEAVYKFENELFFDRGNTDSADSAPKKLEPLPAKTVLHTQTWDSPSATYWRHRFTLRSRYAGALIKGDRREIEAFPGYEENSPDAYYLAKTWTMRAVMLADLSRVQLTRPQLRALIPLTTAIGGGTPSVLAVLQEPPLAVGGLAERTTAELKTGFGYGVETGSPSVEILTARKEIGPDPTLTYSAMPAVEAANLALMAEGPIGLTFDARHAGAPAFANSMFSLTPVALDNEPVRALEEHFLGVTLQRHLEPAWLYTPADANTDAVAVIDQTNQCDASRCWWITYELPETEVAGQNVQLVQAHAHVILNLKIQGEHQIVLEMSKAALDGQDGHIKQFVELCALRRTTKIALLHQPLAAGHFGLSIFVARKDDINEGHSGGWLRVASVEWSVPESSSAATQLLLPIQAEPQATAASAATFIAWTRTHRDFANLTLHGGVSARAMASDVVANVSGTALRFHFPRDPALLHLTSSTYATVEPIHRHRHLGFILTRLRSDDGRPVEQFEQHGLFASEVAQLTGAPKNLDRLNVRLVEIESPAVVLCTRRDKTIPSEYQQGVLDLVATGGTHSDAQKVKLFLRLAGTDRHIQQFRAFTINIGTVENVSETLKIALDFNQFPSLNQGVRLIEIGWSQNQLYIDLVGANGKRERKPPTNEQQALAKQLISHRGLMVTIDAPNQPDCWCDLSVLHSTATTNEAGDYAGVMDLRWLFSQDSGEDMAQALQPSAMAIRTEAQARIVSVSPPIPVVDKISE